MRVGGYCLAMVRIAAATVSEHASRAAQQVADAGGNAVDSAVAASIAGMVSEPGVVSLGGGGFLTIWPSDGAPTTIDGYAAMPGRGQDPSRFGGGVFDAWMAYGGGMTTTVGHGSVAVPGAFSACEAAVERYGAVPWETVVAPAIELADGGFPMSMASYRYLSHCHDTIFGWHEPSFKALHSEGGALIEPGGTVRIPDLPDSLRAIATKGAEVFYRGWLARLIVDDMDAGGGLLTLEDLASYQVETRLPLHVRTGGWDVATNPPPAVGGTTLTALLLLMSGEPRGSWTRGALSRLVAAQRAVFEYRRDRLDPSDDLGNDAGALLEAIERVGPGWALRSPSTIHTSVVDSDGLACAATFSAGYGSGVMPPGTGIWLNNSLGELELNPNGLHSAAPGERLLSNMAPTVARTADGAVVAIGSPGADRITTAILQSFLNFSNLEMSLPDAIEQPRIHVELSSEGPRVAFEPGVELGPIELPTRPFDHPDMFFGGVAAAALHPDGTLEAGVDPRRSGHALVTG
jgi:gamma-glutamyltranspeptidase/glutathione hydrolase